MLLLTVLTFLPAMLLMMTSFTRIVIVLSLLRQALGTPSTPPNQVLVGLSLFLTLFVMGPVLDKVNTDALQALLAKARSTIDRGAGARRRRRSSSFMLRQTRETDLALFAKISRRPGAATARKTCRCRMLVPAFVTSELKTAFQIGFMIFIPFLIIDMVVASVLMSMGMMMLSPAIDLAAVQADAVRAGRRLAVADRLARAELL